MAIDDFSMLERLRRVEAHVHTVLPTLRGRLWPPPEPPSEEVRVRIDDPIVGTVEVGGRLTRVDRSRSAADTDTLAVLVHGLGGCADSAYLRRAAGVAVGELGVDCLRFEMRGADRAGHDIYHAGLSDDLAAVLASPALDRYRSIVLLGFSLGGHVVLRWATAPTDPRVQAVAAVCSPLDLDVAVRTFDLGSRWVYRRYVLGALKDTYAEVAKRRDVPVPVAEVSAVRRLRDYDRLVVVPRFGFGTVGAYYATQSVGGRLHRLDVPALLVATEGDPMVDAESVRAGLRRGGTGLRVAWLRRGGHVGMPPRVVLDPDLGVDAAPGLERQVLTWLIDR